MAFHDDYVPVAERIVAFREQYPEGTLRPADPARPFEIVTVAGSTFLVVVAAAFRSADDVAPGIGMAWEPVPGLTNFTRNSELQNAESSAWGRAIIAVGAADAKRGIASAEDVRNRQSEQSDPLDDPALPGLRSAVQSAIDKWVGKDENRDEDRAAAMVAFFAANDLPPVKRMNAAQTDVVIEHLMSLPVAEGVASQATVTGLANGSATPSDELDLGPEAA